MKPTVIRSLGAALSWFPKTAAGTIVGNAMEPAAAPRKCRRVALPAGRIVGALDGDGFGGSSRDGVGVELDSFRTVSSIGPTGTAAINPPVAPRRSRIDPGQPPRDWRRPGRPDTLYERDLV